MREALDKPLASYYLLLGSSALLLTIGVIMVLSASSVRSYVIYDDSYAVVKRQLMWVALGLPAAWVASRLPIRHIRRLAYPGFLVALVLLGLVARFGVLINGNKNWLALGPFNIQPAEIAKLAIVLWAANIYAHKERRLRELHHLLVPVVPGLFAVIGLVLVGRDLGTAMVLGRDHARHAVGGRRPDAALRAQHLGPRRRRRRRWPRWTPSGSTASRTSPTRSRTTPTPAGSPPTASTPCRAAAGSARASAPRTQKWGDLPEAHTDFIFAVLGEELGLVGTLLVVGLFFTIAYAAIRVALSTAGPVRPLRHLRHHRLAARPDDDQRRHGARGPARSSASRCRSCPTAGRRCCPRWSRSAWSSGSPVASPRPRPPWRHAAATAPPVSRPSDPPLASAPMRVLLAGGGSAGHTSPLLATADALRRLDPATDDHLPRHA